MTTAETLRITLLGRCHELEQKVRRLSRPQEETPQKDESERGSFEEIEGDRVVALEIATRTITQIQEALRRCEVGTIGICRDCGEEISEKRLIAIPWATLCTGCQERNGDNLGYTLRKHERRGIAPRQSGPKRPAPFTRF